MECARVIAEEIAEKYLLGELNEADAEDYERHYFECPRCFEELRAYRATQEVLQRARKERPAEPRKARTRWWWMWLRAAALIVLAVGLSVGWGPFKSADEITAPATRTTGTQAPTPTGTPAPAASHTLAELAQVVPPAYSPVTLRAASGDAEKRFREAMRHYLKADYAATIPGLLTAAQLDPRAPGTHFFLGVCYFLTKKTDAAIQELQQTIVLGESPYLEEAHFYLAKAFLQAGNLEAAREQLTKTAQLQGDLQAEADRLLVELAKLPKSPR